MTRTEHHFSASATLPSMCDKTFNKLEFWLTSITIFQIKIWSRARGVKIDCLKQFIFFLNDTDR